MDQLLTTKFYIPPTRPDLVQRPRLIEQLNTGIIRQLTLISAPAGFGKSTILSSWAAQTKLVQVAWLSLDEADNDLNRFLIYIIGALQTVEPNFGQGLLAILQSPGFPNLEAILTTLINEIAEFSDEVALILDDYHVIESSLIDQAISFLVDHLPVQMHLVIASRMDPTMPLSRLRARRHLTELRVADLRFTSFEIAELFNQIMGLNLSSEDITALETRTEGWIAGLQLAAISIQGYDDTSRFIESFRGSHRHVFDYLIEEVLVQQPETVQTFLLKTSILKRMTGSLCDAITGQDNGQTTLEMLDHANLFIVPLDEDRRWYRYHHLFADLLRQRLRHQMKEHIHELHILASVWYEDNGLRVEAFQHAAAVNDIERTEHLIEGDGVPLQYRGAAALVLNWLASQPANVLDSSPSLWVTYASALNLTGQPNDAELKLQAAEAALQGYQTDAKTNDLVGHIAAIRAMMAVSNNQIETILAQSLRALEYLRTDNLTVRTITTWTLGHAYQLQGNRAEARKAYVEVLSNSQESGDIISTLAAATGLGSIHVSENQLYLAADSYRLGLHLFGDKPQPLTCETFLGLAKILYEWNDLDAAEKHAQQSYQLARQLEYIDTFAICGAFIARLKLAVGDAWGANAMLAQAKRFMHKHNFVDRIREVVAVQVRLLLYQGDLVAAVRLAEKYDLPISQARAYLARGDTSVALDVLRPLRQQVEEIDLKDQLLRVLVLQAVILQAHGDKESSMQALSEALVLGEPGGFIRTFVDEGLPMARLLKEAINYGIELDYSRRLLVAFRTPLQSDASVIKQLLVEPLSRRELEILALVAQGLTNRQISKQLFLAIDTVKGHNRNIFGKLGVKNRTQAVARARELELL